MKPLEPLKPSRRSPLHSLINALQPQWVTINGMATALQFDANDSERMAALGIVDMSFLSRCGLKGPNSRAWLLAKGLPIPEINSWEPLSSGGLIARLGVSEFLIEDSTGETTAKELAQALTSSPDGVYPVLRQDGSFAMTGAFLQKLLRQTCNLNFNAFDLATRPLALTTMVGVPVLIIPAEVAGQPRYRIWFDGTYGGYLWQTLLDVAGEQGGGAVGLACLMQKNFNHLPPQRSAQ